MSKTREERLAKNRERQRRWRAEHRWLGEQRRLATYGMSEAHKRAGFDTNNASIRVIEVVMPESGEVVRVKVDGRTRIGKVLLVLWERATNNGLEGGPVLDKPAACDSNSGVEVEGF